MLEMMRDILASVNTVHPGLVYYDQYPVTVGGCVHLSHVVGRFGQLRDGTIGTNFPSFDIVKMFGLEVGIVKI